MTYLVNSSASLDTLVNKVFDFSSFELGLVELNLQFTNLEVFFEKLVPEDTPWFIHTQEGPDDMPSHIRTALTRTSETIPLIGGRMTLGTWQGVFLFEHRRAPHRREIAVSVIGD